MHNQFKTMSSTPTKQSESDGSSAATAASEAYLDSIGLRSLLKDGVVQLLETNPLPASTLSAWAVLATEITRVIKAQGHGQANDAVASAMLAGFESLVRGGERGRSQTGSATRHTTPAWCGVSEGGLPGCVCVVQVRGPGVHVGLTLSSLVFLPFASLPQPPYLPTPLFTLTFPLDCRRAWSSSHRLYHNHQRLGRRKGRGERGGLFAQRRRGRGTERRRHKCRRGPCCRHVGT